MVIVKKIHRRQLEVARNVAQQITDGSQAIVGVMAKAFYKRDHRKSQQIRC